MTAVLPPNASSSGVVRVAAVMSLALMGDALIYVVLPLHAADFGITFAWVGILLSANRIIRILGYGAIARLAQRLGARRTTVVAAIAGTISTAVYGLCPGEAPLLIAR